jgi:dTDP-3,4-didehydro-2,6-dideoxy-alpha-D-glucose 3-reductase
MHILFLGYSNLLKSRIFPILNFIEEFDTVSIAKFRDQEWDSVYNMLHSKIFLYDNYEIALDSCKSQIVYISTVNSAHFEWAEKFLKKGFHVIIDKPATTSYKDTKKLLSLARSYKLMLAEATVFLYHPQFSLTRDIFLKNSVEPKLLNLSFSFPPMHPSNFRYNKELGGGAVLDTGVYAISPGRYFFNSIPEQIYCTKNNFSGELLTSYSLLANYSGGRSLIGHFGFNTEYINRMNILGEHICVDIDRAFTIPDNMENVIKLKMNNLSDDIIVPKSNMFIHFFKNILKSIQENDFTVFYNNILMDARGVQMIIDAVNKKYT